MDCNLKIKDKNILITGAAGFIGKSFAEKLCKDNNIVCLDISKEIEKNKFGITVLFDIKDKKWFDVVDSKVSGKVDVIFHFSSIVGVENVDEKTSELIDLEVVGMNNVIEYAKKNDALVVYSSSSSVHDIGTKDKEGSHIYPYNLCKLLSEFKLQSSSVKYLIPRFFNVYGKFQDERMVVGNFVANALNGDDLIIYGDGNTTRDYTYVDDAFTILSKCIVENKINNIFDVGQGREITLDELAKTIIDLTSSKSKIKYLPVPEDRKKYEILERCADTKRIKELELYPDFIDLKKGLNIIIEECLK